MSYLTGRPDVIHRCPVCCEDWPRLDRIERAAKALIAALDYCAPDWRAETLNVPKGDGDDVNAAWDELVAAAEGDADENRKPNL